MTSGSQTKVGRSPHTQRAALNGRRRISFGILSVLLAACSASLTSTTDGKRIEDATADASRRDSGDSEAATEGGHGDGTEINDETIPSEAGGDASVASTEEGGGDRSFCQQNADPYDLPANGVCSVGGFCQGSFLPVAQSLDQIWEDSNSLWMSGKGVIVRLNNGFRGRTGLDESVSRFIVGSSANDLWFGPTMHWNGVHLEKAQHPAPAATVAMWFATPNDGWAVDGTNTAYHFDGTAWNPVPTGALAGVTGVVGFASNDVWAVGGPSLRRWNGTAWVAAPVPLPDGETGRIMVGNRPDNIYVAGSQLFHFNGLAWTSKSNVDVNTLSLSASATAVTIVGHGAIGTWDGVTSKYDSAASAHCRTCGSCTNAVVSASGTSFTTGWPYSGKPSEGLCPAFKYWGGLSVSAMAYSPPFGPAIMLSGGAIMEAGKRVRWGATNSDIAVGLTVNAPNDIWVSGYYNALFMASHYDGTHWSYSTLPAKPISEVGAASPVSAWVLLEGSRVAYWDGATWTEKGLIPTSLLVGIWGSSATDAWAAGETGVFHWNGRTWSPASEMASRHFVAFRGFSPNQILAIRRDFDGGGLYRFNGASWSHVPDSNHFFFQYPGTESILGPDNVWVVANQSGPGAFQWNGTGWKRFWGNPQSLYATRVYGTAEKVWLGSSTETHVIECTP